VASASTDSILTGPLALQLVTAVKTNMTAKGYTFKPRSQGLPDLGLRLTVIKDITRTAVCGGWWDGWWGYYPPWYWGCYYCGGYYYPWCTTYTYTVGTSALYMFDIKNQGANHDCGLSGVLRCLGCSVLQITKPTPTLLLRQSTRPSLNPLTSKSKP
jgi:hypothetical protein